MASSIMVKSVHAYIAYSRRVWGVLLLSLPLDLLAIPFLGGIAITEETLFLPFDLATLFAALFVIWISRLESPSVIFESVRKLRSKNKFIYLCSAILIALALIGMAHVFTPVLWKMFSSGNYLVVLTISAFVIMGILGALREQISILKRRATASKINTHSIDQAHKEILFLTLLPMVVARTLSLVGVIRTYLTGGDPLSLLAFSSISLILLIASEPRKTHFIASCKNCFGAVSVSISHVGVCPSCAARALKHSAGSK